MHMKDNHRPIDMAFEMRRQVREKEERDLQEREEKVLQKEYYATKTEYEKLTTVDIKEAEQEQERINQELQEPPPIPQESRLKMNIVKAMIYGAFALVMTIAGAVLAFSVLDIVLYLFSFLVRWIMAIAIIGGSVVVFHWAIKQMNARARRMLIFILLFVSLVNIGALAWIRAEYSSIKAQQDTGELTAEQAQKESEKLDGILVIVHAILALALETLGALSASRAAMLIDENWPNLSKYRRRHYWERVYAKRIKRKIELEIELERLGKNLNQNENNDGE